MPLDVLVANTEGFLGYVLQQALLNHLRRREMKRYVVTMITQVLVERDDPAFQNPSKPIGPFRTKEQAEGGAIAWAGTSWKTPPAAGGAWWPRPGRCVSSSAT